MAVVLAVMVETGLNRQELGKLILAACFVTDLGTVLALGGLFADFGNAVMFADGTLAEPPIALCEIQGYAYDARRRAARLSKKIWGDERLAERLLAQAEELRDRFNRDFWIEERGHYALALDGRKRQVDSLTFGDDRSVMRPDGAVVILDRVVPRVVGGHRSRRYGFREEAGRLAVSLLEAAQEFGYRLPEVFAGLPREETEMPVAYPTASRPQAWSAGTPLMAIRTLIGLDAIDGKLGSDPKGMRGSASIKGLFVRGERFDVESD